MLSYQLETFGRPLSRVLRETPVPQGTEVLLKVSCCGVCHSDVHLHDGYFDLGAGNRLDMARSVNPPRTLGHEIAGVVAAFGPDAKGIAPGDRRIVFPWIGCGRCSLCAAGQEHLCNAQQALGVGRDGGFADHLLVPHPRVLLGYEPLADAQACTLGCSGLTAYGALKKLGPDAHFGAGDALLIIGAGGVGLSGIRLAKQMFGVAPIVAEVDRAKWDIARDAGAGDVIDPAAEGAAKALAKATGGGVAAAVDFVGAAGSFAFGHGALKKGGTLVSVGLLGGATTIVPAMLALKSVRIVGSYVGSLVEMQELVALAPALPPMPVTERPLDTVSEALETCAPGA